MVEVVRELYEAGLITSTGGNVSVRIPGCADELWMTPHGLHKGRLHGDEMTWIDLDGETLDADSPTPSSERFVHTGMFRRRPDVEAVIHTHAPQATILALTDQPFLPISTEAAFIGEIPRVPFIMPGSKELADRVVEALGEGAAVLMQNHGLVVGGCTLRSAVDTTLVIEQTAMKILACRRLGVEPPVLPPEIVSTFQALGGMAG